VGGVTHYPRINRPCNECPFRTDVKVGRFAPERFKALRKTIDPNYHDIPHPMFGCHKTTGGAVRACAGWLAVCGELNLSVRLALVMRRLPHCALMPGEDWPELYPDYETMAKANGV